ncbi:MAG: TIGR00730 family Rossman fold protein, partial [Clostridia bacterium]|nr:TIGR00730 family Rossman fold protein [Clostridia bacterium]
MRICLFGAASPLIDEIYIKKVEELGRKMVERGHSLVFGGGANGLMGAAARGVRDAGGHMLGVIPTFFEDEYVEEVCDFCNELIETNTM